MSRTFQIDERFLYPVSESSLELALYVFCDTKSAQNQKDLSHQIIQVYILREFLKDGYSYIEESIFIARFKNLIKDFENRILVMANYSDVIFNDDKNKFEFALTKSGKLAVNKALGLN